MHRLLQPSFLLLSLLGFSLAACHETRPNPAFDQVKADYLPREQRILDRNGEVLYGHRSDPSGKRLEWTTLNQVSPVVVQAVILTEDQRFAHHYGVDWWALIATPRQWMRGHFTHDASTLTMQLTRMLALTGLPEDAPRLQNKIQEIKAAHRLEQGWYKEQIMEAYLNLASFYGGMQGIAAAAKVWFHKTPAELKGEEALLLAASLADPEAPTEELAARACVVTKRLPMAASCQSLEKLAKETFQGRPELRSNETLPPHIARLLKPEALVVASSLDAATQKKATEFLGEELALLKSYKVHDGAVLIADHRTGEILAYVGNAGANSQAPHVDAILTPQQAGTSLLPFAFARALDRKLITMATELEHRVPEEPRVMIVGPAGTTVEDGQQLESSEAPPAPEIRLVNLREALIASLPHPYEEVKTKLGPEDYHKLLRDLHLLPSETPSEEKPSETMNVTLWSLVQAYSSLAEQGVLRPLRLEHDPTPATQPNWISAEASFLASHMLSDRVTMTKVAGSSYPGITPYWSAVKSSWSEDFRHHWSIGYSARYTVGVWMGFAESMSPHAPGSTRGSIAVWRRVMDELHTKETSEPPPAPPTLAEADFLGRDGSKRRDWFFADALPSPPPEQEKGPVSQVKIAYPTSRSPVFYDPFAPVSRQVLMFRADAGRTKVQNVVWVLNKNRLKSPAIRMDKMRKGRHVLELRDSKGRLLDTVRFELKQKPSRASRLSADG